MSQDLQILSKFTIGGQELKNRVVMAPLTRGRCDLTEDPLDLSNTNPNELMVEHYAQRASAGLIISEATSISELGHGWLGAPSIRTQDNVAGWKKVTEAVHEKGGLIYLQLWHMGRQSHSSFHPTTGKVVSSSDIPMPGEVKSISGEAVAGETPVPLTIEEIKETVKDYVKATRLAKEAGFDGVEVHGANGYLIDQFLQSCSNKRTDEYGGSMENRIRLVKEILDAIIADGAFPANRIGFRMSPNGAFGGMGSEDNKELFPFIAKTLNEYNLAYIHVMDGLGFGFHGKCSIVTMSDIKKVYDGPLICNVGLTKEIAEGMVRSGASDLVCFGRPYISNPDLVERFANNWPLAPDAPYETWWTKKGAEGYTDFPAYKPTKVEEK